MPDVFEDTLSEITGTPAAASPELQPEQTQSTPSESNAFEAALAEKVQESEAPEQTQQRDMPEPGGGRER